MNTGLGRFQSTWEITATQTVDTVSTPAITPQPNTHRVINWNHKVNLHWSLSSLIYHKLDWTDLLPELRLKAAIWSALCTHTQSFALCTISTKTSATTNGWETAIMGSRRKVTDLVETPPLRHVSFPLADVISQNMFGCNHPWEPHKCWHFSCLC